MFLSEAPLSDDIRAAFEAERAADGFVANHTRLWAWRHDLDKAFLALRGQLIASSSLTERERAVIVSAAVSAVGDSYCSLAWGARIASLIGDDDAALLLRRGEPGSLTVRERALLRWIRSVVDDPNATQQTDVDALRSAGLSDREIFEATLFAAFRVAFSTVNDALGATPDRGLYEAVPAEIRAAVTFGRSAG